MRSDKYKKKKRRHRKKINPKSLFMIVIIAVVCLTGFTIIGNFHGKSYDDEESFQKFAYKQFDNIDKSAISDESIKDKEKIKFGEKTSSAVRIPVTGIKMVDGRVRAVVDDMNHQNAAFDRKLYRNNKNMEKTAYVTSYSLYESDMDTRCILIKTDRFAQETGDRLYKEGELAYAVNYTLKDGIPITSVMVFKNDYRNIISASVKEELEDSYSEELKENYADAINPENQSFDNFVLTDKGADFIFNSGTVSERNETLMISVDRKDHKDIFREKINPKVLDPSKPMVALTFDDGPAAGTTARILSALEKNGATATFFELGQNVENVAGSGKLLKRMLAGGSEVGSHSYDHPNLYQLTDSQIREQVEKTDKAIEERTGQKPTLYRPPYGNGNDEITEIFNKPGILWTVDTLDWQSRNKDSINSIIKNSGDLDGKVILMHSIYDSSAEAVEEIIPWLKSKGYQLVTVSELLTYKYNQNPADVRYYGYGYFTGPVK